MAKPKIIYKCTECEATSPKWAGKCVVCNAWGSLEKDESINVSSGKNFAGISPTKTVSLSAVKEKEANRAETGIDEFDRCLGGGIVPGSVILLGGDPGVGKSTLALQVAQSLLLNKAKILYVAGEESPSQIKLRAQRLGKNSFQELKFLADTNLPAVLATAMDSKPNLLIIDSIQTLNNPDSSGVPGSVAQVSGCASKLVEVAKRNNIATLIVGHVTKEGYIAGPKTLEHTVDVVLYFEGDRFGQLRILRAAKNRFGGINEVGVFEMTPQGLTEVDNPSKMFLDEDLKKRNGVAMTAVLEGSRVIACEIQALLSKSSLAYPKRTAVGFDQNRLWLLLAVLGKYGKLPVYENDVFVNVIGGLKIDEPASDLPVTLAMISSLLEIPLSSDIASFGEVGLSGEIRPVSQVDRRLAEIERLGFSKVIIPAKQKVGKTNIEMVRVGDVQELLKKVFGKKKRAKK